MTFSKIVVLSSKDLWQRVIISLTLAAGPNSQRRLSSSLRKDQTYDLGRFRSVGGTEVHSASHSNRAQRRVSCPLTVVRILCHSLCRGEISSLRRLSCMWKDKRMSPSRMSWSVFSDKNSTKSNDNDETRLQVVFDPDL